MLRLLLVWVIISCGAEDPPDSNSYRIDVEGLTYGEHISLGTKLTDISVKVTKFLVSTEYNDDANTFIYDFRDEGAVTSGSLQIDIECQEGEETFKELELDINSATTKVPEIEFASDNFRQDSCELIVDYDDGIAKRHKRQEISFRIVDESHCLELGEEQILIGKGFQKKCSNQTFKLTKQCGDDLKLFYYSGLVNTPRLLSELSFDNDHAVIVMTEADDSWSIPKGCALWSNNRDVAITKPSAKQNLAQLVEITAVSKSGRRVDFDSNGHFYLTVGNGWYRQSSNNNIAYPDNLGWLAIMTHKDSWWSYLSGPEVSSADDRPLRAGQPISWRESPFPKRIVHFIFITMAHLLTIPTNS